MDFLKKLWNNVVIRNILILVVVFFIVFYGSLIVLRFYTHHGEALSVPDARGLSIEDAGKLLESRKMRWHLSDSVYVTSAAPGTVVSQNPEPNAKVKENRNIFLVINAMMPEKVKMPNVVGVSLRQAQSILTSSGLNVGKLRYEPDIAQNNVLRQVFEGKVITPGTEIIKGSNIDLVLGQGLSAQRVQVPNLVGFSLIDARSELTKYSLNFGVVIYDKSVATKADSIKAFIWQQKPVNAELQLGSPVDVWLTVDEAKKPNTAQSEIDK